MERKDKDTPFRIWVNPASRVVSFHAEEGFDLLEFRDRELFFRCIDEYTRQQYRYQ